MNTGKVVYYVNGVASNIWRRLAASKTFWVVVVFLLTNAILWNNQDISGQVFFQTVQVGVIGILLRAAMTKSENASNALNPEVTNVSAVTVAKPAKSKYGTMGVFVCMAGLSGLMLSGCSIPGAAKSMITNIDGKPVVSGTICVNTPQGRICYVPTEPVIVEPEKVPVNAAAVPESTLLPPPPVPYSDVPPGSQPRTLEK